MIKIIMILTLLTSNTATMHTQRSVQFKKLHLKTLVQIYQNTKKNDDNKKIIEQLQFAIIIKCMKEGIVLKQYLNMFKQTN